MDRQQFIIGCIIGVLLAGGVVWWFVQGHRASRPVSSTQSSTGTSTYLLLSEGSVGTTTTQFPVTVIIQLLAAEYSTSTVTISDPGSILSDRQIQSYKTYTVVSGTVHGPGTLVIGPRQLTFSFSNESH